MPMWTLELTKEKFKFAASHFAIFGPYCGERLHGHNYYVSVFFKADQLDENLGLAIEFNEVKPKIYELIQTLDEYVLFPQNSPHLKISETVTNWEIIFNEKLYSLPKSDVLFLPVTNISCEELSRYLCDKLRPYFASFSNVRELSLQVEETRGQKATYTVHFDQ